MNPETKMKMIGADASEPTVGKVSFRQTRTASLPSVYFSDLLRLVMESSGSGSGWPAFP